jgi:hypothetical protein
MALLKNRSSAYSSVTRSPAIRTKFAVVSILLKRSLVTLDRNGINYRSDAFWRRAQLWADWILSDHPSHNAHGSL